MPLEQNPPLLLEHPVDLRFREFAAEDSDRRQRAQDVAHCTETDHDDAEVPALSVQCLT